MQPVASIAVNAALGAVLVSRRGPAGAALAAIAALIGWNMAMGLSIPRHLRLFPGVLADGPDKSAADCPAGRLGMRRPPAVRLLEAIVRLTMLAHRHLEVFDRCYQCRSLGIAGGVDSARGAPLPRRQITVTTGTRPPSSTMTEAAGRGFHKIEDPAHSSQYHHFGPERPL